MNGRISKISSKKDELYKIIDHRIESLISSTNIEQQKTSQRLNWWVLILTVVLTVFGAASLIDNLQLSLGSHIVLVISSILFETMLIFSLGDTDTAADSTK